MRIVARCQLLLQASCPPHRCYGNSNRYICFAPMSQNTRTFSFYVCNPLQPLEDQMDFERKVSHLSTFVTHYNHQICEGTKWWLELLYNTILCSFTTSLIGYLYMSQIIKNFPLRDSSHACITGLSHRHASCMYHRSFTFISWFLCRLDLPFAPRKHTI